MMSPFFSSPEFIASLTTTERIRLLRQDTQPRRSRTRLFGHRHDR